MRRLLTPFVLVTLLAPASAALADDPASERLAARLGDRIHVTTVPERGTSVEWGKATGVIDAPFKTVWKVLQDYARYHEFIPHFKKSRVLSRRGSDALVYMEAGVIKNTVTLWAQTRIKAKEGSDGTRVLEGRMMQGNMKRFAARFELTPLAGGSQTLVTFRLLVDPDLMLPSSVFTHENKKSARKTVKALRRQVEAHRLRLAQNR